MFAETAPFINHLPVQQFEIGSVAQVITGKTQKETVEDFGVEPADQGFLAPG